jgi:hypothetical protein
MTQLRSTSVVRLLAVALSFAVIAAACGDDGGESSTQAFCDALEEQDANENLDLDNPEDLAAFNELIDQAPDEVRGAMEELRDLTEDMEALAEEGEGGEADFEAGLEAMFSIFANPDFLKAIQDVSVFMADECGLEVEGIDEIRELDPDDPASLFGGTGGTATLEDGGGDSSTGDDEPFSSGSDDDEPSPSEELGLYLDENYADAAWADLVIGKAIGTFGDSADITLSLNTEDEPIGDGDAVEACEAVVEWTEGRYDGDVTVTVTEFQGRELATAADGGSCAPV